MISINLSQLPNALWYLSIALLVGGVLALFAVLILWSRVGTFYRDWNGKAGVAVARWSTAATALVARFIPSNEASEPVLVAASLLGITGWLAWELTQVIGEVRTKSTIKSLEQDLADEKLASEEKDRQINVWMTVLAYFRELVNNKKDRLAKAVSQSSDRRARRENLRRQLDPPAHAKALISKMVSSSPVSRCRLSACKGERKGRSVRI